MGKGKKLKKDTATSDDDDDDDECCCCWWLVQKGTTASVFIIVGLFALLVRAAVLLHPYSGAGNAPKFRDYEAQRHWMEININLPIKEWYWNSYSNDLSYWGLDYPPLTAYRSFVQTLHPDSVGLFASRGHESYLGKLLMSTTASAWALPLALLLLSSLGMIFVTSVLYFLALNHKQMSAYFAPAFFSHLLSKCLRHKYPILEVSKLGLLVLGPFAAVLWPYLYSTQSILEVSLVLLHLKFEDYVANFWCASSILIKWKRLFTTELLKLISLTATVVICLPSMVQQIKSPSN